MDDHPNGAITPDDRELSEALLGDPDFYQEMRDAFLEGMRSGDPGPDSVGDETYFQTLLDAADADEARPREPETPERAFRRLMGQ